MQVSFKEVFLYGCAGSSLLCGLSLVAASRGYSLAAVRRLFVAVASLVVEHRLKGVRASVIMEHRLQSTGSVVVALWLSCPAACGSCPAACVIFSEQESNPCPLHCKADS